MDAKLHTSSCNVMRVGHSKHGTSGVASDRLAVCSRIIFPGAHASKDGTVRKRTDRQTDGQTGRQTDRRTDRQTDGQTRQTDRHTDRNLRTEFLRVLCKFRTEKLCQRLCATIFHNMPGTSWA